MGGDSPEIVLFVWLNCCNLMYCCLFISVSIVLLVYCNVCILYCFVFVMFVFVLFELCILYCIY